jgi:hypothetical protein
MKSCEDGGFFWWYQKIKIEIVVEKLKTKILLQQIIDLNEKQNIL